MAFEDAESESERDRLLAELIGIANGVRKAVLLGNEKIEKVIDTRQKTTATCSGDECRPKDLSTIPSSVLPRSLGRLAWSREREALSRVKSQEHELKQLYVGTDCVELTPVDMKPLMVESGSPVACSGEEVTDASPFDHAYCACLLEFISMFMHGHDRDEIFDTLQVSPELAARLTNMESLEWEIG